MYVCGKEKEKERKRERERERVGTLGPLTFSPGRIESLVVVMVRRVLGLHSMSNARAMTVAR